MADAGYGGVSTGPTMWVLKKALSYWTPGPEQQVAQKALSDLSREFNKTYLFILDVGYIDETLSAIREEVKRMQEGGERPNAQRLSQAIRAHTPEKVSDDFDLAIEFFCSKLLIRAQEHAEFAGKVQAHTLTTVERQLDEIAKNLDGVLPAPDSLACECRKLALEKLEGFSRELGEVPNWDDLSFVRDIGDPPHVEPAAPLNTHLAMIDHGFSVVIRGRAGIGKTTLLRAAAGWINNENAARSAAIFVPLREWQHQSNDLVAFTAARLGIGNEISPYHLRFLATHGRLCLVMDGWNELNAVSAEAAKVQLLQLFRDYPYLAVVVSSRDRPDIPSFPTSIGLEVLLLSREQRDSILAASIPAPQDDMIAQILADQELNEITRNPFYLRRFVEAAIRGEARSNREQLIAASVESIESAEKAKAALKASTGPFHRAYLIDLSLLMFEESQRLKLGLARRSVTRTSEALADQIGTAPSPQDVLEALRDHHLLVWTGEDAEGGIEFPHQLFQEWFASLHFERLAKQVDATDRVSYSPEIGQ